MAPIDWLLKLNNFFDWILYHPPLLLDNCTMQELLARPRSLNAKVSRGVYNDYELKICVLMVKVSLSILLEVMWYENEFLYICSSWSKFIISTINRPITTEQTVF